MKIFKKAMKITGIILASVIVFLITVVLLVKLFENDLASIALDELEKEIKAPMSIGKVSAIPLFSFPRFSAEINDLWIGQPGSDHNDSLFCLSSLKVGLDTWDLIKGKYTIHKLEISGLSFDYYINKKGNSNIDFLINAFADTTAQIEDMPSDSSLAVSPLFLTAEKARITDITLTYFDSTTNTSARVYIPEISFNAKTQNNEYRISAEGNIVFSNCCFEESKLDLMKSGEVAFKMDFADNMLKIEKFTAMSEGVKMDLAGTADLGDTIALDVLLGADELDFSILKKYIPDAYTAFVPELTSGDISPMYISVAAKYHENDLFVKELNFKTEGIDLAVNGTFVLGDTISVDALMEAREIDYRIIKKYIPAMVLKEYGIIDLNGKMAFSAAVYGKYADSTLMPGIVADVSLDKVGVVTRDYPEISALNFKGVITSGNLANPEHTLINISEFEVNTPQSFVNLSGEFQGIANMKYDFETSLRINLAEFEKYIPDTLAKNVSGEISARLKTSGILPDSITDAFIDEILNRSTVGLQCRKVSGNYMESTRVDNFGADISYNLNSDGSKKLRIENLAVQSDDMNVDLENSSVMMVFKGQLSNLPGLEIDIKSLRLQQGFNLITGAATIKNPENPDFTMNASLTLKLDELMPFVPDSLVSAMSGNVNVFLRSRGRINFDQLDEQMYPIIFNNSRFDIVCNDVSVSFPDSTMNFKELSADLSLENDLLNITKLAATYNGLPVEVDSTIVENLYKAVLLNQDEQLYVNTHINLGDIDFDDFGYLMAVDNAETVPSSNEPDSSQPANAEPQNWTFLIHGSAAVKSFSMDTTEFSGYQVNRLHLEDISTLFKLTDSAYIADQFKFKAFKGEANNSFYFKLRDDGAQTVSSSHNIRDIDIRMLLKDLNNLEMDSMITWQNISGRLSSELNMFFPLDSTMIEKMMISGDIVLEEGGVYDYGPAQEMSRFTRIKELDNIQFKTLRSSIFMFKNKIWVPRTNIVSNALDIVAFGMFDMNYEYDYHLEVHLSNILFGKSKKRNRKQDAKGEEVNEETLKKSSHKIRYADVEGETKMGWDTKSSREEMINRIRVQKKMLDFIFFPKNIHYNTDVPEKI